MKKILFDYLKEEKYNLASSKSNGISLNINHGELLIKGSKIDLIELANYILNVAISKEENDHLHLDDMTLLNDSSMIKNLIIKKI